MADLVLRERTCRVCGRPKQTEIPEGQGRCAECAAAVLPAPGDPFREGERRTVLARLRERYAEVRAMASAEEPHANLDWLIGSSPRPGFVPGSMDVERAQVVLLWLQDLTRELEDEAPPMAGAAARGPDRQGAARGLRTATKDFAEAFLPPPPDCAGSP